MKNEIHKKVLKFNVDFNLLVALSFFYLLIVYYLPMLFLSSPASPFNYSYDNDNVL